MLFRSTPALNWQVSLATAAGRTLSPAAAALADTLTGQIPADD